MKGMTKMIGSISNTINASSLNLNNNTKVDGKVTIKGEDEKSIMQQKEDEATAVSKDGDTFTISSKSSKVFQSSSKQSALDSVLSYSSEDSTDASGMASVVSNAASSIGITETSTEANESSSSDSNDLSSYTETELKEMVQDGEISQAEYNAEIKKRSENSSSDDTTQAETAVTAQAAVEE